MSKKGKTLITLSVTFNFLFLLLGGYFIYNRGGIKYITSKVEAVMKSETAVDLHHIERTSLFDNLAISQDDIVFVGDSLIEANNWNELFPNQFTKNRGIIADTTEGVLNRIDGIIDGQPKKIFFMVGTNDIEFGVSSKEIVSNYKQIIQNIQKGSPETDIYVESILPINDDALLSNRTNESIKSLNSELETLTDQLQVNYIDLYTSFLDEDNKLDDKLSEDGLHLNGEGYILWKSEIEKLVN